MKKRIYRATELTKVNIEQLAEKVKGKRVIFGVDIAKQDNYGALLIWGEKVPLITIKWRHPERSRQVVQALKRLCAVKSGSCHGTQRDIWRSGTQVVLG